MTIHIYTKPSGCVAVVRRGGREVWRSRLVPVGMGGLAWGLARDWTRGQR